MSYADSIAEEAEESMECNYWQFVGLDCTVSTNTTRTVACCNSNVFAILLVDSTVLGKRAYSNEFNSSCLLRIMAGHDCVS